MPSLYTSIEINAPQSLVWQVLYHKERWLYWNTFLYDSDPSLPFQPGQIVFLSLRRIPGEDLTDFAPHVTWMEPIHGLQWVATIPGLTCQSSFELQTVGRDRTQYIHQERFSGRLARWVLPFIREDEQRGICRMAWELKDYAERHHQRAIAHPS